MQLSFLLFLALDVLNLVEFLVPVFVNYPGA